MMAPYQAKFKGPKSLFLNFLISYLAVGSAGCINLCLMRSSEMKNGITLRTEDGTEVGKSKIIGKQAVLQTGLTRFLMPIPPLLIPTLIFYFAEKRHLIPKQKFAKFGFEAFVFWASLAIAPPMAGALFS